MLACGGERTYIKLVAKFAGDIFLSFFWHLYYRVDNITSPRPWLISSSVAFLQITSGRGLRESDERAFCVRLHSSRTGGSQSVLGVAGR